MFAKVTPELSETKSESGSVVSYLQGVVHKAGCFQSGDDGGSQVRRLLNLRLD
jgi:hypothetical protein